MYTLFNKGIGAIQIVGNYKALSNSFAIKKGETQRYKAEMALTLDVSDIPPAWTPYLYRRRIDLDPRPADCGFILTFIVPEENDTVFTAVTGCFFFASNAVWAYHDMSQTNAHLQIVGDRPFFSHAKFVAEFDTSKKHAYEIEYHRACNPDDSYIRWYVDGKLVRTQTNLGFIPEREPNDLFDSISLNVPCGQQLESRVDPALAQMLIETGQQQHALQAIVGSPGEKGLAPSIPVPPSAYCFPTSFVTEPTPVHVESSLSIYHLEVKRRFH